PRSSSRCRSAADPSSNAPSLAPPLASSTYSCVSRIPSTRIRAASPGFGPLPTLVEAEVRVPGVNYGVSFQPAEPALPGSIFLAAAELAFPGSICLGAPGRGGLRRQRGGSLAVLDSHRAPRHDARVDGPAALRQRRLRRLRGRRWLRGVSLRAFLCHMAADQGRPDGGGDLWAQVRALSEKNGERAERCWAPRCSPSAAVAPS